MGEHINSGSEDQSQNPIRDQVAGEGVIVSSVASFLQGRLTRGQFIVSSGLIGAGIFGGKVGFDALIESNMVADAQLRQEYARAGLTDQEIEDIQIQPRSTPPAISLPTENELRLREAVAEGSQEEAIRIIHSDDYINESKRYIIGRKLKAIDKNFWESEKGKELARNSFIQMSAGTLSFCLVVVPGIMKLLIGGLIKLADTSKNKPDRSMNSEE